MKTDSRILFTRHASISLKKILRKNYDYVGTSCDSDLDSSHLGEKFNFYFYGSSYPNKKAEEY